MTSNILNSDLGNDHPHSASTLLLFNRLRCGGTIRQALRLRYVPFNPISLCFFFFAAWVIIGMIWTFCSAFIVVLYPLWESREALGQITGGLIKVR